MNCKKCGAQLTENDQFCKNCGASVYAQDQQNNFQQTMNNQPNLMQQPVNNMQQNYSGNNQNSWQNNYNPMPNYQQQKPNNNGVLTAIIVVIVVAIVTAGIILGIRFFGNNENSNNGGNSGESGISNTTNSTYSVKFKGFTFKIPDNLIYRSDSDILYIGDDAGTWAAAVEIGNGSFSNLQSNKGQLIINAQNAGYVAANVNQKTYGGLDYVTVELAKDGQNMILGFAKANSMYLFCVRAYNLDNTFDYNLLSNVAKILKTAEYSGETNNISFDNKIDFEIFSDLVK